MPRMAKRPQSTVESVVAGKLRGARAEGRVKMSVLADEVGLSREQLSRILNGHKPASFSEMVAIASALGVDLGAVVSEAQREVAAASQDQEPEVEVPRGRVARTNRKRPAANTQVGGNDFTKDTTAP